MFKKESLEEEESESAVTSLSKICEESSCPPTPKKAHVDLMTSDVETKGDILAQLHPM
jgi:hypothetical protein